MGAKVVRPKPGDLVREDCSPDETLGTIISVIDDETVLVMWSTGLTAFERSQRDMIENMRRQITNEIDNDILEALKNGGSNL